MSGEKSETGTLQKFHLGKQHEKNFFRHLNELRRENLFCDVRFNVNGTIFPCHRLVLASISPYFKCMLNGNFLEADSDIIPLKDVEMNAFEVILDAIYTATINLCPENAYFIFKTSNLLQLETIEEACVSYIIGNLKISHLIETCLFAKSIKRMELYYVCVRELSEGLLDYGKIDSFMKVSFDVFKSILMNRPFNNNEEEAIFLIISKWSEFNAATSNEVRALLELADLNTTRNIRPSVMAELIVKSYNSSADNTCASALDFCEEIEVENRFNMNLYLNIVDSKTKEKGWGVLKVNNRFDNFSLSSVHITKSSFRKVCQIGSKLFCFENSLDQNVFSCYDEEKNYERTILNLPPHCYFQSYEMTAMDNSIYLVKIGVATNSIWIFDCVNNSWEQKFVHFPYGKNYLNNDSFQLFSSCTSSTDGVFYLIANSCANVQKHLYSFNNRSSIGRLLVRYEFNDHVNAAICAFDGKIALSGSYHENVLHNTFSIFDITASRWINGVSPMNIGRAGHNLLHYNGFVYAVENNRPFIENEKYDLKANKWLNISSIPKKVLFECRNNGNVSVISTGELFGINV